MPRGQLPDYIAWNPKQGEAWTRMGVAFVGRDRDKGAITLRINAMPLGAFDGKIVLLPPRDARQPDTTPEPVASDDAGPAF